MSGHKTFLYEKIAGEIADLITQGTFRPGERIPSVRQMSKQRKISVTTALQAYLSLEDHGLIEARPQSGYYVRARLPLILAEPEQSAPSPDPCHVSMHELVMMVLRDTTNPKLVQLGAAIPNPELVATDKLNRIMGAEARRLGSLTGLYDIPPGYDPLRVQIAQRAVAAGCHLAPGDIVTTSGCLEAFGLCLRAICRAGDTVAIESPTYFGVLQVLESLELRALEIPTHPRDGISLAALRFAIEHNPVKACLLLPTFHNPLGSTMPDDNKKELVEMLAAHEIPLIEGDASGEIYFSGDRPLPAKAFDQKGLVMLCSSFSKVLSPGLRVGWVAPGRFKSTVEWLKYTTNIATATLAEITIARFLDSGGYDHHLRVIRRAYARNMAQMSQAVMRHFPSQTRVTRPNGGFVLWVQLPERVDSLRLYRQALNAGVTLAPGHIFSATDQYRNFIRLNAAFWSELSNKAIQKLGKMISESS